MDKNSLRIVFMGTPEFAASCLDTLVVSGYNVVAVVTQPDKPVGRKHIITPPPAKVKALELGLDVYQPDSVKTDEAYETFKAYEPDLIVTAAYGKILPERLLKLPKYECINVHASLLPNYRGAAPIQRSILNGDKFTGVTIMKMDIGMDTGDILTTVKVDIDPDIHTDMLTEDLAGAGSNLLVNTIPDYVEGKISPIKQDDDLATFCPPIKPEEGYFTWDMSALDIHNKVRALSTWPGAYTLDVNGRKLKIYKSSVDENTAYGRDIAPGTIVKAHKADLIIATGDGFLRLLEIQTEGGKRLEAINCAHNFHVGTVI